MYIVRTLKILKVVEMIFFIRLFLNVERPEVQPPPSTNSTSLSNSVTSITTTGSAGSVEQQSNDASEGGALSSSSNNGATSSSSLHSHIEEVPAIANFIFTPVNRFGNAVEEGRRLEDTGMGW